MKFNNLPILTLVTAAALTAILAGWFVNGGSDRHHTFALQDVELTRVVDGLESAAGETIQT